MPPDTRVARRSLRIGLAGLVLGALAALLAVFAIALCLSGTRCIGDPDHLLGVIFVGSGLAIASALLCLFSLWQRRRAHRRFLGEGRAGRR
jgi:hypothetical protein